MLNESSRVENNENCAWRITASDLPLSIINSAINKNGCKTLCVVTGAFQRSAKQMNAFARFYDSHICTAKACDISTHTSINICHWPPITFLLHRTVHLSNINFDFAANEMIYFYRSNRDKKKQRHHLFAVIFKLYFVTLAELHLMQSLKTRNYFDLQHKNKLKTVK